MNKCYQWAGKPEYENLRRTSMRLFSYFSTLLVQTDTPSSKKIQRDWTNWYNDGDIMILADQVLGERDVR